MGRPDAALGEDPAEGPLRDGETLALGQQLRKVGVVDPGVRRRRELDDVTPELVLDPVGGWSPPVAVDQAGRAVGVAGDEAPDLAGRELEDPRRLVEGQAAGDHMIEDVRAVPPPHVGLGQSVTVLHAPEGDKVAGRLARTESLAVHTDENKR